MKKSLLFLFFGVVTTPMLVSAQSMGGSSSFQTPSFVAADPYYSGGISIVTPPHVSFSRPLSRVAIGLGLSPLGGGILTATNISRHFNVRSVGNFVKYSVSDFNTNGFVVSPKLSLASAGTSLDYYPFHNGFRLSPGVLYYNKNQATATFQALAGASFTLNNQTYYSGSGTYAVKGTGNLGLGKGSTSLTMTTGWGNVLPTKGRRLSFPVEVGAAFMKPPTVSLALTGQACDAQGFNCVDVATDPTVQANLNLQIAKYQNNLSMLRTFPILAFGVAYNFKIR